MRRKIYYLYIFAVIIAFFLAVIPLRTQVVFHYDQARDAFESYKIWHDKDVKILGPATDIPGVYHGALWYYALALPYALSSGDPQLTAQIFFILSLLTIPLCGYVALKIFQDKHIAFLSMALYSLSPIFQASTRWLSNPLLALYITPLLLLCLWNYLNKQDKRTALFLGILIGLLIQSNFAYSLFVITLPIYVYVYKVKIKTRNLFLFAVGFLLSVSTFIASEIKFDGRAIKSITNYLVSSDTSSQSLINKLPFFIDRITNLLSITIFPLPKFLIIIFFILSFFLIVKFIRSKSEKKPVYFILIWLSNIIFFQFFNSGVIQSSYIFMPSVIAVIMLGSFLIVKNIRGIIYWVIVVAIFAAQINISLSWINNSFSPLSIQHGMYVQSEKQLIDYTYKASNYENFSIISITNPLYINTTWAYLYQFYGEKKYKYTPYWLGSSQTGYLGNLIEKKNNTKYLYLIIESTIGIPEFYVDKIINEENQSTEIIEEKRFGELHVQKRQSRSIKPKIL